LEHIIREKEADSRSEKTLKLPDSWRGKKIQWKEKIKSRGFWVFVAGIVVAICIFFAADKDLHDTVERRKRQMQKELYFPNRKVKNWKP